MPFYDYACSDCDEVFEVFHGITSKQDFCIKCKSSKIQITYKNIHAPEVLVPGSWMDERFLYDSETTYEPTRYGRKSWDKPKRSKFFRVS